MTGCPLGFMLKMEAALINKQGEALDVGRVSRRASRVGMAGAGQTA